MDAQRKLNKFCQAYMLLWGHLVLFCLYYFVVVVSSTRAHMQTDRMRYDLNNLGHLAWHATTMSLLLGSSLFGPALVTNEFRSLTSEITLAMRTRGVSLRG